jgi:hypothetical protein
MKKAIALFGISALALALALPALANSWTSNGSDDFIVIQTSKSAREFEVENKSTAIIKNKLVVSANSGDNFIAAAGDIEDGNITSGNADVNVTEYSDVNSLTVIDECCEVANDGDENTGTSTGDDDFILNQNSETEDEWEVENESFVFDDTQSEVYTNTGQNFMAAGEDVEEGTTGITSGLSSIMYDRTLYRNYVSVNRLKN